ncbi:MAG: hypothetical protein AAFX99_34355 [Myxococcota bacterium]
MADESNRQKKKRIQEGVRRLRNTPGWDPAAFRRPSPQEQLRALDQESRNAQTYTETEVCPACLTQRQTSGDETALCETHLQEALGF